MAPSLSACAFRTRLPPVPLQLSPLLGSPVATSTWAAPRVRLHVAILTRLLMCAGPLDRPRVRLQSERLRAPVEHSADAARERRAYRGAASRTTSGNRTTWCSTTAALRHSLSSAWPASASLNDRVEESTLLISNSESTNGV